MRARNALVRVFTTCGWCGGGGGGSGTDYGIWIRGGPGWRRKTADDGIRGRARRKEAPNESENEGLHGSHCDVRGRMRRPRENDEGCWEDERKATNALSSPRKCVSFPSADSDLERDAQSAASKGKADMH